MTSKSTGSANKIVFQKNYTRDTSLFLQDIWARDQSIVLPELLGSPNQCLPGIIHYVNNGTVEIWENVAATQWLMDAMFAINKKGGEFTREKLEQYQDLLPSLKVFWQKGTLSTKQELKDFAELIEHAITGFNIFYRTGYDDRTPRPLRELALKIRENDTLFSSSDVLIHRSLGNIFPETRGYENYIFAGEIDKLPPLDILKKRKEGFVVIDGTDTYLGKLTDYATLHPDYTFEFDSVPTGLKEVKGQVAYKGKVTGTVRLLFRREQMDTVKVGDILVSPMTTPDILPAMQKAAAFVTDEGGITCHAAIVAREMKKPCIIGTKIATQVLHDGDTVEVDAEKGIVKIIR